MRHHAKGLVPAECSTVVLAPYDRVAWFYDIAESLLEVRARRWRRAQWADVGHGRILEVGVGTGLSIPFYPRDVRVVGVDVSPRMLDRAHRRAARIQANAELVVGDVQALAYPDATFDVVVTTFVFCSVPDPILGLREIRRVLRPGGRLIMVEHVASKSPFLRRLMKALDPLIAHFLGEHIARDTVANVGAAGFARVSAHNLAHGIVCRIEAVA